MIRSEVIMTKGDIWFFPTIIIFVLIVLLFETANKASSYKAELRVLKEVCIIATKGGGDD